MQEATLRRVRLAAAAAIAGGTALFSLLALAALNLGGAARLGPVRLLELEKGYDREVVAALEAGPKPDYARAEALSRTAVTLFPYDTSAWMRIGVFAAARQGRLGPEGLRALQTSYDLIAYDPYVFDWRIKLGLDHWRELPPALRESVIDEVRTFARNGNRSRVIASLATVQDPAGKLAAAILAQELQ